MNKLITIFCSILLIAALSGCAVSATRTSQTYERIDIQLSGHDKGRYYLVSDQGRTVGLTTGASGKLTFQIPSEAPLQGCYTILNEKGKTLLQNPAWFYPSVRQRYLAVASRYNSAQRQAAQNEQAQRTASSLLAQARADLASSAAWKGNACVAPAQGIIPPQPTAPCSSRDECTAKANEGCFSEFMTKQFCGLLLLKIEIPGFSIAACNGAVKLFDLDTYGAEGQFNNTMALALGGALLAAIIQSRDDHAKDEDWSVLKVTHYAIEILNAAKEYGEVKTCTEETVERQYGPVERWMNEYGGAQAESNQQLQSCLGDQITLDRESARLSDAAAAAPRLASDLADLDLQVKYAQSQQEPFAACTVRSAPARPAPRSTYRRRIGY